MVSRRMQSGTEESDNSKTSRRKLLAGIGGAGAAALAGCSDGSENSPSSNNESRSNNESDGSASSGGDDPVDPELTNAGDFMVYTNAQWNPYNPKGYPGRSANALFDPLSRYDPNEGSFIPYALANWSASTSGMTLEVREGQTWHNGDTVDAQDLATKLKLDRHMELPISHFVSDIQQDGDLAVKLTFDGEVNPSIFKHVMLNDRMNVKHEMFVDKLTALEDASTEEETQQAREGLISYSIEDPIGNGPFVLDDINQDKLTYKTGEEHRAASDINYPRFGQLGVEGNQEIWSSIKGDKVDIGGAFTPKDVRRGFPDHWFTVLLPNWWGMGLAFQHEDPIYGRRKVRQALAHVINRSQVAENSGGESKVGVKIPSGIPGDYRETVSRWLPKDMQQQFNDYSVDTDKAATLLEDEGFTKSNGEWQTPDGEAFTANVKVNSGWSDWVTGVQSLVGDLKQFGINANVRTVEGTSFGSEVQDGNFRVAAWPWASGYPHPYFNFDHLLASSGAKNSWNYPQNPSVPMPVGDASGSTETVDVQKQVAQLAKTTGEDATALIHELAWVVNQTLPILPIQAKTRMIHFSTDQWEVPNQDDPILQINPPSYWLPRNGKIKAKTE